MYFFGIIIYNNINRYFYILLVLKDNDKGGELWPIYIRLQIL